LQIRRQADPTGAVVPGVTVTLVNPTNGQTQTTMTAAKGLYGFSLLSPSTYGVDFSAQGFKTSRAVSVVVNVSEAPELAKLEAFDKEFSQVGETGVKCAAKEAKVF
jgi:Carboxypeptidase regulatory-like domain